MSVLLTSGRIPLLCCLRRQNAARSLLTHRRGLSQTENHGALDGVHVPSRWKHHRKQSTSISSTERVREQTIAKRQLRTRMKPKNTWQGCAARQHLAPPLRVLSWHGNVTTWIWKMVRTNATTNTWFLWHRRKTRVFSPS